MSEQIAASQGPQPVMPEPAKTEATSQFTAGESLPVQVPESQGPPPDKSEPVKTKAPRPSAPEHLFKNRLQEYTQRSALPFPVYNTINDGFPHAPKFRSTVFVDGTYYPSPNTFLHRKAAELDAARIALHYISEKMKIEGCPNIHEDTVFCKLILNEYAAKTNLEKPIYNTIQLEALLPAFVSSLVFNGVTYTGDTGTNKKEAEQLAARAAILSLLGSESGTVIGEIIKSKSKLYAALNRAKDSCSTHNGIMYAGIQTGYNLGVASSKGKEMDVSGGTNSMPITAISEHCSGQPANIHTIHPSLHEFRIPKQEASSEAITLPIQFVPPVLEQPLVTGSISGRKRNRKNKKKAKKKAQVDAKLIVDAVPLSEVPHCSVAQ